MYRLLRMNIHLIFRKSYILTALLVTSFFAIGSVLSAKFLGSQLPGFDFRNYSEHFCIFLSEGFLLVYFAYSVGFMVPEDYSSGYIKNILRADPSRKGFIFSKLLIISLFVIFVTAMFALILLLAHIIFMPDFYFGSFANFATAFGLQSILTITLASVVMMIGSFFRKSVYTLILSTFLCTGTVESGLYTINLLQNKIWAKEYFDFTKLGLYEAVSNRPELKANIVYLLALCTVYLFLSQIISVYLIRNKDIK